MNTSHSSIPTDRAFGGSPLPVSGKPFKPTSEQLSHLACSIRLIMCASRPWQLFYLALVLLVSVVMYVFYPSDPMNHTSSRASDTPRSQPQLVEEGPGPEEIGLDVSMLLESNRREKCNSRELAATVNDAIEKTTTTTTTTAPDCSSYERSADVSTTDTISSCTADTSSNCTTAVYESTDQTFDQTSYHPTNTAPDFSSYERSTDTSSDCIGNNKVQHWFMIKSAELVCRVVFHQR